MHTSENNGNKKRIMTVKEVSEFLRIPVSTIYGLTQKGRLRAVKIGKHWRFLEEDILALWGNL